MLLKIPVDAVHCGNFTIRSVCMPVDICRFFSFPLHGFSRYFVPMAVALLTVGVPFGKLCASLPDSVFIAYFTEDVTPALESPLAFGSVRKISDSLRARGIILRFDEYPVVLCAVDWIGVSNEGMDYFKEKLAAAAGTKPERVSVHALHLHDGVRADLSAPRLLDRYGDSKIYYDTVFLREVIDRVALSAEKAMEDFQAVTHVGYGEARVEKVASNRRILNRAGKVQAMRWNSTSDLRLRGEPEGVVDPLLRMVTFWKEENPLIALSYYAVHPVTFFGEGVVSADFVGFARENEEIRKGIPQIYFTGAAGNIGVGKYNNGSVQIRQVLAARLGMAMDQAYAQTIRRPVGKSDFLWKTVEVYLPLASFMNRDSLESVLTGKSYDPELPFLRAVSSLAWLERVHQNPEVQVSALHMGDIRLLHLPGEPFVEYQLTAQRCFPDLKICTAAYGEYGMGYIGTAVAYEEGGYETSKMASNVAPESEEILLKAIRRVLE